MCYSSFARFVDHREYSSFCRRLSGLPLRTAIGNHIFVVDHITETRTLFDVTLRFIFYTLSDIRFIFFTLPFLHALYLFLILQPLLPMKHYLIVVVIKNYDVIFYFYIFDRHRKISFLCLIINTMLQRQEKRNN